MNDARLTAELESLIQGYVGGDLTPRECARLHDLLKGSPELVAPILASLRMDALIRQTVRQTARPDLVMLPEGGMAQGMAGSGPKRSRRFVLGLAVAACLVVLVALGARFLGPGKTLQPVVPPTGSTA